MTAETTSPTPRRSRRLLGQALLVVVTAAATVGVLLLLENIGERKEEGRQHAFRVVDLTEDTVDPKEWAKNYPRQYDGYARTVDAERTKHGGSEAVPLQRLKAHPEWTTLFKGYAFSVDFRGARGHAHMLSDQDMTERVNAPFKQPGACVHCHSSPLLTYRAEGITLGVPSDEDHRWEAVMKGFEKVCGMPYAEARKLVSHPVACIDCHDPDSLQLRVTRPTFLNSVKGLARTDAPVPHLPSVERWRQGPRSKDYDPNVEAGRQEMRSLVCGQCHVEYYFKGPNKVVTYPWARGLKADDIEAYYDEDAGGFVDWTHELTGAGMLKAQHPEFEMWSQGIHARSGVACADCHMAYKREGAIKVTDHHVRSPLLNTARACQVCHNYTESELKARVETIQDRTYALLRRGEAALMDTVRAIQEAKKAGATDKELAGPRRMHRRAQWRLDYVFSENSLGFHADQEAARLLGEAIDFARQGQAGALRLLIPNK